MVVVADAGMLSATNLKELDEAGLRFIVGSRVTKAPNDLASHFRWHGDAFTDGQVIDTITPRVSTATARAKNDENKRAEPVWDPAVHPTSWRAVWAYSAKRAVRDSADPHVAGEPGQGRRRRRDQPPAPHGSSVSRTAPGPWTRPPWPGPGGWSGSRDTSRTSPPR